MNLETAQAIALMACAEIMQADDLRDRFLAMSGLTGDMIRSQIEEPGFLVGVLSFLSAYEPDLLAIAQAINAPPEALVAALQTLQGPEV